MKVDWSLVVTLVIAFALGALVNQYLATGKLFASSKVTTNPVSTGNSIQDYVRTHYPNAS